MAIGTRLLKDKVVTCPARARVFNKIIQGSRSLEKILKSIDEIASRDQREVVIPDGYTAIGNGAFGFCTSLERVIIPESVSVIGDDAFADCPKLTITRR